MSDSEEEIIEEIEEVVEEEDEENDDTQIHVSSNTGDNPTSSGGEPTITQERDV